MSNAPSSADGADFIVIGAGIVGAATASALAQAMPGARIILMEKERGPALHQTGRNSGVIHSGIYYKPGSLKAELCRAGHARTIAYCEEKGLPWEPRGKLLVATDDLEVERLNALETRAGENGVEVQRLDAAGLRKEESAITGLGALLVPSTGIVGYTAITKSLIDDLSREGGDARFGCEVLGIERIGARWNVRTSGGTFSAGHIVACGGLLSDRIARLAGIEPSVRIVPFKGEYYVLPPSRNKLVHRMIYPVPDPNLPFLGVHLTPMIDGSITVGPNAVLSLAREGYGKFGFDWRDAREALAFPGLWKLLSRYPRAIASELASTASRRFYLKLLRKYCPELTLEDLAGYRGGIRAQAVSRDGAMVEDFMIEEREGATIVLNAPSPAATSAFPIADHIVATIVRGRQGRGPEKRQTAAASAS